MSEMICPHCHGTVSRGARVCRGCQAEIEYGTPPAYILFLLIFSVIIGVKTTSFLPEFMGWIVGVGVFIGGFIGINKIFIDRVNFKRIYRTK